MNKDQLIKHLESKFVSKKIENENKNYGSKTISVEGLIITFRREKKTTIYPGHFIALYKRYPRTNKTQPLTYTDYNYLIVLTIRDCKHSIFIFPAKILLEKNIFSDECTNEISRKGKTGFRVFNPHEISKKKYNWQKEYFYEITKEEYMFLQNI